MVYKHDYILYVETVNPNMEEEGVFTIHPDLSSNLTEKLDLENAYLKRLKECSSKKEIELLMKHQFEGSPQHDQGPWINMFYKFFIRFIMENEGALDQWRYNELMNWVLNRQNGPKCKLEIELELEEAQIETNQDYHKLGGFKGIWFYLGSDKAKFTRSLKRLMAMTTHSLPEFRRFLEDWLRKYPSKRAYVLNLREIYFLENSGDNHLHFPIETSQYNIINGFIDALGPLDTEGFYETGLTPKISQVEVRKNCALLIKKGSYVPKGTDIENLLAIFNPAPLPHGWEPTPWLESRKNCFSFMMDMVGDGIQAHSINQFFKQYGIDSKTKKPNTNPLRASDRTSSKRGFLDYLK